MTDSLSQLGRRILGQNITRSAETGSGSGGSVSSPSQHSGAVDGASSFARVDGVSGAKATVESKVAGAIARIGQIITNELVQDGQDATFSAAGVTALFMLAAAGTEAGAERDAFLKALGLDGLSLQQINEAGSALATRLASLDAGVGINFANIAISNSEKSGGFTDSFTQGVKSGINTDVIDKPLNDPKAREAERQAVNAKILATTKNLIKDFLSAEKLSQTIWMLINACGFEGTLTKPFVDGNELIADPGYKTRLAEDKDGSFAESLRKSAKEWLREGETLAPDAKLAEDEWRRDAAKYLEVPYLEGATHEITPRLQEAVKEVNGRMKLTTNRLKVLDNARFAGVMFPYGPKEGAYFLAMLPKGNVTPKQLLADVGTKAFTAAVKNAEARPYDASDSFQIGAFKTSFKPDGVLDTFGKIAPLVFSALTKSGPKSPNDAVLEAKIDFSARKTTAGQVASLGALESAGPPPPPPIELIFDKSFAYAIVTPDGQAVWQGQRQVK